MNKIPTIPPMLTTEEVEALRREQASFAKQWVAATTLEGLQAMRQASLQMLISMLNRTKNPPVETPTISSDVVNRVAGYRPYQAGDMQHW